MTNGSRHGHRHYQRKSLQRSPCIHARPRPGLTRHFSLACYCACAVEFPVKSLCAGTLEHTWPMPTTLSCWQDTFHKTERVFCVLPAGRTCPKGRTLSKLRQLSSFSSFYWIDNNVSTRKLGPSSGPGYHWGQDPPPLLRLFSHLWS